MMKALWESVVEYEFLVCRAEEGRGAYWRYLAYCGWVQ